MIRIFFNFLGFCVVSGWVLSGPYAQAQDKVLPAIIPAPQPNSLATPEPPRSKEYLALVEMAWHQKSTKDPVVFAQRLAEISRVIPSVFSPDTDECGMLVQSTSFALGRLQNNYEYFPSVRTPESARILGQLLLRHYTFLVKQMTGFTPLKDRPSHEEFPKGLIGGNPEFQLTPEEWKMYKVKLTAYHRNDCINNTYHACARSIKILYTAIQQFLKSTESGVSLDADLVGKLKNIPPIITNPKNPAEAMPANANANPDPNVTLDPVGGGR